MTSLPKKLEGKVAIVTASTEGIGYAVAKRLAEDGASVMISSRRQKKVDEAVAKLKSENLTNVKGVVCHAGKEDHRNYLIEETLRSFGGIDMLVCNAASNPSPGPFFDTTEEAWDKVFHVNLKSAFLLIKAVIPYMEKRGGGSIVTVSSVVAHRTDAVPGVHASAYGISKISLIGLTKALVPECAAKNIRINCMSPGVIETRFSEVIWKNSFANKNAMALIPMKRLGQSSECAGVVSFLCSDDSSYISGETIIVGGGMSCRL
uniref:Dehydrogenase/reductase SDR family member 4-like n=1 Tax=Saccoglossus kowalevskii TaxID=10224 RepID=A0ABM0MPA8_SACKO|nr:PREDICTED: dehydrogenase/reductase SDR family member 4-like [Saccoglossus kowalevskii]